MKNAITKPVSFQVGNVVRAQLGNEGEKNYRPECDVVILDITGDALGRPVYLVKPVGEKNFIAAAVDMNGSPLEDEIKGRLYSTDARIFGQGTAGEHFGFLTEDQARTSLGF